jgi:hypothetical protein
MIEVVEKEKKTLNKHVFKKTHFHSIQRDFLIWNYAKNDLWNLKMFSLNQFWWFVIIWINSLHNNNNNIIIIIIIIIIYHLCVVPTNVGQLLETKNDPQTFIKAFPMIHNNGSQPIQRNLLNFICKHNFFN